MQIFSKADLLTELQRAERPLTLGFLPPIPSASNSPSLSEKKFQTNLNSNVFINLNGVSTNFARRAGICKFRDFEQRSFMHAYSGTNSDSSDISGRELESLTRTIVRAQFEMAKLVDAHPPGTILLLPFQTLMLPKATRRTVTDDEKERGGDENDSCNVHHTWHEGKTELKHAVRAWYYHVPQA